MALHLRQDSDFLDSQAAGEDLPSVTRLREMPQALRSRVLERYLKSCGVKEPEDVHLEQMEGLIAFTESFCLGNFPGRGYHRTTL